MTQSQIAQQVEISQLHVPPDPALARKDPRDDRRRRKESLTR
jgi:hypothetical protein